MTDLLSSLAARYARLRRHLKLQRMFWSWLRARDIRRHDAKHLATYIVSVNQPSRFR